MEPVVLHLVVQVSRIDMVSAGVAGNGTCSWTLISQISYSFCGEVDSLCLKTLKELLASLETLAPKLDETLALAATIDAVNLGVKADHMLALEELIPHIDLIDMGWQLV